VAQKLVSFMDSADVRALCFRPTQECLEMANTLDQTLRFLNAVIFSLGYVKEGRLSVLIMVVETR
jgi:hypothetical protein